MFYAYLLQSTSDPSHLYRGHTTDLKQRLTDHNSGRCPHTAKHAPWKVKFYAAFETLAAFSPACAGICASEGAVSFHRGKGTAGRGGVL
jgi:hypothetical protein